MEYILFGILNILIFSLTFTSKYTIPFFNKLWYLYRRQWYPGEKRLYGWQEDEAAEKKVTKLLARFIFYNIMFMYVGCIIMPLMGYRFYVAIIMTLALYGLGWGRVTSLWEIDIHFRNNKVKNVTEVEKRNINYAQAIIELEQEVLRLKKAYGEKPVANKKLKKKKQSSTIRFDLDS